MKIDEIKQKAILANGFDRLNDMQEDMLSVAFEDRNVLLLSPTGSGKTLAFLIPTVARVSEGHNAIIIVPSRELALQILDVYSNIKCGIRAICCYGGHDIKKEIAELSSLKDNDNLLLIGTSGRILDHFTRGNIKPEKFETLILDEYDKSMELGFEEEMKEIVSQLTNLNQRILTSATHSMPISKWLNFTDYKQIDYLPRVKSEGENKYEIQDNLDIYQVKSPINDKLETLRELICSLDDDAQIIIFSNYRESSERISHYLAENGIDNALYHGGLDQDKREKAIARFRGNSIRILVSTDLASRGLDIPDVSHIIHYHLPSTEEVFVHRNGRTARAGANGTAYLIIGPNEFTPEFITKEPKYFRIKPKGTFTPSPNVTVYIGRGKKEKISKGDIVGFFTKNGNIDGSKIGRIDIMEHCAYCSMDRTVVDAVLEKVKGLKIKGEKTHYLIVTGC